MSSLNDHYRRSNPVSAYVTRHLQVALATLGRIARAPFASFLTMLVIAITLALPAGLHLAVKNAMLLSGGWENAVDFSLYFKPATSEEDARNLGNIIAQRADVDSVRFVSADDALTEFKENAGFAGALASLTENPLPHALVVRPASIAGEATIGALRTDLANLPETDQVQLDTEWVSRFHAILALIERGVVMVAGLLGIAVMIVIGNTIRLDIQNRRDEIVVTKLVGASDGFIRRPFLYSGLVHGVAGGLLALALIWAGLYLLSEPVKTLAGLYASGFRLDSLSAQESGLLVATGAVLGWLGSFVATARHLRRIEPK